VSIEERPIKEDPIDLLFKRADELGSVNLVYQRSKEQGIDMWDFDDGCGDDGDEFSN